MSDLTLLAERLLDANDSASLSPPPSDDDPAFDLDAAYRVADLVRQRRIARGAVPRGYKIGFTNRRIWSRYNVFAPIWGTVYDDTLVLLDGAEARITLAGLCQPRIEPEIMFGLAAAPQAGMDGAALAACIDWVAHGFEIVQTHFDGWRFRAPDTVADAGLHGRLLVGPRLNPSRFDDLAGALRALHVELMCDGAVVDRGDGSLALGGPLQALREWVDAMATTTPQWPIRSGDVVTTGTLTDAWPIEPGQRWQTRLSDQRLPGLTLECAPR